MPEKSWGGDAIIGLSVENEEQVIEANSFDLAYIALSPIFSTPTKTDTKTEWGLAGLRRVKALSKHPVVAIGGVNHFNLTEIMLQGADGVAVVSAVCSSVDPYQSALQLRESINRVRKSYKLSTTIM